MTKIITHRSKDGYYQYYHKEQWDGDKELITYICLNPTTREEKIIKKLSTYAKAGGYGGFYLCYLFAYLTDDFMYVLKQGREVAIGKHNDKWLKRVAKNSKDIVLAWGINGKSFRRCDEVIKMFPSAKVFKTELPYPAHPKYLEGIPKLVKYKAQ